MYPCTMCGTPLNGPVCPQCGQAHEAPGQPVATSPQTAQQPTPQWQGAGKPPPAFVEPDPPPPSPTSTPSKAVMSVVLASIALVGIGALAWYYLTPRPNTAEVAPVPSVTTVVESPTQTPTPSEEPTQVDTTTTPAVESTVTVTVAASPSVQEPPPVRVEPTVDVQEAARTTLGEMRQESLTRLSLDGRWVAVLSTKRSGIEDASQTAKNGSHVFYDDDILALHQALASKFSGDADVLLVRTSDFGKQPKSGNVFWRTIADRGFYDEEQAASWCNYHFTGTAKEIENACLPKQLVPPTKP